MKEKNYGGVSNQTPKSVAEENASKDNPVNKNFDVVPVGVLTAICEDTSLKYLSELMESEKGADVCFAKKAISEAFTTAFYTAFALSPGEVPDRPSQLKELTLTVLRTYNFAIKLLPDLIGELDSLSEFKIDEYTLESIFVFNKNTEKYCLYHLRTVAFTELKEAETKEQINESLRMQKNEYVFAVSERGKITNYAETVEENILTEKKPDPNKITKITDMLLN